MGRNHRDQLRKKGRIYQCTKCNLTGERRVVERHFIHNHVPLSKVRYGCTLCLHKMVSDTERVRHRNSLLHRKKCSSMGVNVDSMIRENHHPYKPTAGTGDEDDLYQWSVSDSQREWRRRVIGEEEEMSPDGLTDLSDGPDDVFFGCTSVDRLSPVFQPTPEKDDCGEDPEITLLEPSVLKATPEEPSILKTTLEDSSTIETNPEEPLILETNQGEATTPLFSLPLDLGPARNLFSVMRDIGCAVNTEESSVETSSGVRDSSHMESAESQENIPIVEVTPTEETSVETSSGVRDSSHMESAESQENISVIKVIPPNVLTVPKDNPPVVEATPPRVPEVSSEDPPVEISPKVSVEAQGNPMVVAASSPETQALVRESTPEIATVSSSKVSTATASSPVVGGIQPSTVPLEVEPEAMDTTPVAATLPSPLIELLNSQLQTQAAVAKSITAQNNLLENIQALLVETNKHLCTLVEKTISQNTDIKSTKHAVKDLLAVTKSQLPKTTPTVTKPQKSKPSSTVAKPPSKRRR